MIKLIASDIDGTLVEDGSSRINPEIYKEIIRLRQKGIQFAAASGRQWFSIDRLFEPIREKIFYLSDNGAYIGCHARNLFLTEVDRETIMEMIEDARKQRELEIVLSGPDVVYLDTKNDELCRWLTDSYHFAIQRVEDLTKVEDRFIKIAFYSDSQVETYGKAIQEKYQDRLKITISGEMWMDCMAKGVNKGQAIKTLQESLDILPEETMVFGDQLNDIEMLNQAYYSFAVGNARPEIKKSARFLADTNIHDGVLKILRLL